MSLIDRQAAIEAVLDLDAEHRVSWQDAVIDMLDGLPSAQSEIIRCKDCKRWYAGSYINHSKCGAECVVMKRRMMPDDFCSYAEPWEGEEHG